MANDLINNAYLMEPPKKIKWRGSKSFQVSEHTEELRGGTPEESMKAAHPLPSPGPLHRLHLAVAELCPLQQTSNSKWSAFLCSVNHSRNLSNPRKGSWESPIYRWLIRSTSDNVGLTRGIWSGGQCCVSKPLPCGVCPNSAYLAAELFNVRGKPTYLVSEVL